MNCLSNPALEVIQRLASDMNKSKRKLFYIYQSRVLRSLAGDKLQGDVQSWLSPPDPWKNHNIACDLRHTGTATWFIHGDSFLEWKSSGPSSLLWAHGKRMWLSSPYTFAFISLTVSPFIAGAGKSILWYVDNPIISVLVTNHAQFINHRGH
jgi:hypothetical protein